jgi:glutamine amidotransferase-like uncharacterized protein
MRLMLTGLAMLVAAVVLEAGNTVAYAQSCQALWVERNSFYKSAGYCFKTARAISYFGNAGCRFENEARVPLSRGARSRIAVITRIERRLGCSD